MDTLERLRRFITDDLGWYGPSGDLTPDYGLIDNGVLDSLGIFRMVGFLEDDFGVEVEDDDLVPENFATLAAICALVETKRGSDQPATER
jgi:acyl carrier protein